MENSQENKQNQPIGWHSRGYLPHFDGGEICQFITFRLADSLPQKVLHRWKLELDNRQITDAGFRKKVEIYLDLGYGENLLKTDEIASMVEETLLFYDAKKYKLIAWVVMPNHVHFLAVPLPDSQLSQIMKSIKSYTAYEANRIFCRKGSFWFPDYFDRFIRNHEHFVKTVHYIETNPVKANLCKSVEDWKFSSANFNQQMRSLV